MIEEENASSSIYKRRKEGKAMKIKVIAGITVQIVSISCPSIKNRDENEFVMILIIMYNVIIVIMKIINMEWSWKKIICSIIGEFLLENIIFDQVIISYLIKILFWLKVCSEGGKFSCHSLDELENWEIKIIRLEIKESHKIMINIITLKEEIILPKEEIKFHLAKKSG